MVFGNNLRFILSILHKIICCGYLLEAPRRGASNEYPQLMILWRNEQIHLSIIEKCPIYYYATCESFDFSVFDVNCTNSRNAEAK